MAFKLMDLGLDGRGFEDIVDHFGGVVGDADESGAFVSSDEFFHALVSLEPRHVNSPFPCALCRGTYADGINTNGAYWEMHEIQVKVLKT